MMRKSFLKQYKQGMYASYVLSGELVAHLNAIDNQANERLDLLVEQMMKVEGADLEVIEPVKLRERVHDMILDMKERYEK